MVTVICPYGIPIEIPEPDPEEFRRKAEHTRDIYRIFSEIFNDDSLIAKYFREMKKIYEEVVSNLDAGHSPTDLCECIFKRDKITRETYERLDEAGRKIVRISHYAAFDTVEPCLAQERVRKN